MSSLIEQKVQFFCNSLGEAQASWMKQGSKFALRIRINAKKSEAKRIRFASLRIKSLVVRFAFASHFWRIIRINSPKFALFKLTLVKVFLFGFGLKMVVVVIRSYI